uniref:Phosphoenolpyruvate carboxylase n=1 Tax=Glycine max TaxID=3847 RepID=A0A0R0L301_SOYBN
MKYDGVSPDLWFCSSFLEVEIVLTAHPTQINHRTLQYKHLKIAVGEKTSIWQTDELRRSKPAPVDEARAAVPHYLRRVSSALKKHTGKPLPLTCTPIKFGSWMGGDRDGNPNVTAKVTKDVSLLSRWMAIDLYIREVDGLRFELSMNQCSDKLSELAHEILKGNDEEDHHEHWNGSMSRSQSKHPNQQASPLPTKLPAGAHIPSCAWPDTCLIFSRQPNHKGGETSSSTESNGGSQNVRLSIPILPNSSSSLVSMTYSPSFNSSQLVAQRKLFAESQIGRTSFQRLLEPNSDSYRHGPSKHDPMDYYETKYQLLEPLLLCYESLQLCGSGVLADGRLADLIRRVATFGMVLMKLDLRQESSRHAETIDAITRYLDMGTYSEWDEEKKLDFLTRELKGKRPLVPPSIESFQGVVDFLAQELFNQNASIILHTYTITLQKKMREKERERGRETERGRERRRVTDRDRRNERWSETDTARTSVKQYRNTARTSTNRRTPNGSPSRRWRSMD